MKRRTTPLWGVFDDDGDCWNVFFEESSAKQYKDEHDKATLTIIRGFFVAAPKPKSKPYPSWVCHECGNNGKRYTLSQKKYLGRGTFCSTIHEGTCGVCGKVKSVTEPRDYGYPHFKGHKAP